MALPQANLPRGLLKMLHNALVKEEALVARRAEKVAELEAGGLTEAGVAAAWARVKGRRTAAAGLPALEVLASAQAAADTAAAAAAAHLEATQCAATAEAAAAQLQHINADCCSLCEVMAKGIAVAQEARRAVAETAAACASRNVVAAAERARVEAALKASEQAAERAAPARAAILLIHRACIEDPDAVPSGLLQQGAASGEKVLIQNASISDAEVSDILFLNFVFTCLIVRLYIHTCSSALPSKRRRVAVAANHVIMLRS